MSEICARFSLVLLLFLIVAIPSRFLTEQKEIFPFFAFTLYTRTPTEVEHITVFVNSLEGVTQLPALNIYEHQEYSLRDGGVMRHLFDNWHRAYLKKDAAACANLERIICAKVLDPRVNSFTIAQETFSPYHKLRFGARSKIDSIKRVDVPN